jgi:membrane-bound inhibitor of C-type lysozyme
VASIRTAIPFALAIFSTLLFAASEPTASASADESAPTAITSLTYLCDGGKKLVAVADNTDLDHPKTTISVEGNGALQGIVMHDVLSANGVKTSNGKLVWWTKGDEGFLSEEDPPKGSGDVLIGDCKEVPAK